MLSPMQSRDSFLASALLVLFRNSAGLFGRYTLVGYVPREVIVQLSDPTTVSEVIAKCRTLGAVDEAFRLVSEALNRDWSKIRPDGKRELIELIREHGLEDQFGPRMLRLSATDEEGLRIRWDVADMLYGQEKDRLLQELKGRKIDLLEGDAPNLVVPAVQKEVFDSLIVLLRSRVDYDLSVIIFAAPASRHRYLSEVRGRCNNEYLDILDVVQRALVKSFCEWQVIQGFDGSGVPLHVQEKVLKVFRETAHALMQKISGTIANEKIYNRVKEFLASAQSSNITYIQEHNVNKYEIKGGQQGAVGDSAHADHFVQQQIVETPIEIPDIVALSGELSKLRIEAQKRARSSKEIRATAELAEAEEAAQKGDKKLVIEKLKNAGEWVLGVAKEIGTSVAAKLLAQTLGLPS
jgi:hypothetical protein